VRLEWARVDLRQEVPGMHRLAFLEGDLGDLPLDLGTYGIGVVRLDGADAAQVDRDLPAFDGLRDNRYRRRAGRSRHCLSFGCAEVKA